MNRRGRVRRAPAAALLWSLLAASGCSGARGGTPHPPPSETAPQSRREAAYRHLAARRWDAALADLNALLDQDPSDMRLRMERGYARQAAGTPAAAADEFTLVARVEGPYQEQARGALAVLAAESAPGARESAVEALLNKGYDDLRRGDEGPARVKFSQVLLEEPGKTEVRKQLGYMSLADGDLVAAASQLEGVRRLAPLDHQTALELGYIYHSLHDRPRAVRSFTAALGSPDPAVRESAQSALRVVKQDDAPFYVDVYASPHQSARFRNRIVHLEAKGGYRPPGLRWASATLAARWDRDSRSRIGTVPEVYSDNVFSVAPGLRLQPEGVSAHLSLEYGAAFNLLRTAEHPRRVEPEGRAVLVDYRYWPGPWRSFFDLGGSVGYYSRHRDNLIAEAQARLGAKVFDSGSSQLTVYVPLRGVRDSNRDFYNNLAEFGLGGEVQPSTRLNLTLRGEVLRGVYAGLSGVDPNPYGARYRETRVLLVYAGHFSWGGPRPEPVVRKARRLYLW